MAMNMNVKGKKSVFALFQSRIEVENAVDSLKAAGFRHSDISVLLPEMGDTKNFAHEKGTKAPEGTTTGATAGALVGGGLGWLVGIGTIAIPGLGPFIAAGPIMAALAGAGVGGAVGGLSGALIGMGIPEYEAKRYAGLVERGGFLISVHVDDSDWQRKAKDILEAQGGEDISTSGEVRGEKTDSSLRRDTDSTVRY